MESQVGSYVKIIGKLRQYKIEDLEPFSKTADRARRQYYADNFNLVKDCVGGYQRYMA